MLLYANCSVCRRALALSAWDRESLDADVFMRLGHPESRLGGDENQVCASNTSSDSACVFKGRSAPSVSPTSESHGIKREDFRQNMNGSWTPIRKVAPSGSNGPFSVEPDQMLGIGPSNRASVYGVKMARTLNDQCR